MSTWQFSVHPFPTTAAWKKLDIDEGMLLLIAVGERTKYALVKKTDITEQEEGVFALGSTAKTAFFDVKPSCEAALLQEPESVGKYCQFKNVSQIDPYIRLDSSCWLVSAEKKDGRQLSIQKFSFYLLLVRIRATCVDTARTAPNLIVKMNEMKVPYFF
jgi:hypothetical protein